MGLISAKSVDGLGNAISARFTGYRDQRPSGGPQQGAASKAAERLENGVPVLRPIVTIVGIFSVLPIGERFQSRAYHELLFPIAVFA